MMSTADNDSSSSTGSSSNSGSSDKERVLELLTTCTTTKSALELSQMCQLEKSVVNKCLYSLLKRGQVRLVNGTPPLWSAKNSAASMDTYQQDQDKLIGILQANEGIHGMSTCSMALCMQKTTRVVNQLLYALQDDGKVKKIQESPPAWRMVQKTSRSSQKDVNTAERKVTGKRSVDDSFQSSQNKNLPNNAKRPRKESIGQSDASMGLDGFILTKNIAEAHHSFQTNDGSSAWAIQCAQVVWKKYKEIYSAAKDNDIVAGFLLREKANTGSVEPNLVALGSGTSIASGESYSMLGHTVQDSHAEIVARRSLLRWLYLQLKAAKSGQDSFAILNKSKNDGLPYTLKPFDLWLYVSQAPCGDSAVFSRADMRHDKTSGATPHHKSQGKFRTKTEAGSGTHLRAHTLYFEVSMDGLQRGDRAVCHSCSDKIAKWNAVGVQGALLSRLVPPLYMAGISIGDLFHHDHLTRALCCRNSTALSGAKRKTSESLPAPYTLCHPIIREAPKNTPRHEKLKAHDGLSINWTALDTEVELVESKSGCVVQTKVPSRICKKHLFRNFCDLLPDAKEQSYAVNKRMDGGYHSAKRCWLESMEEYNTGHWMHKPAEVDDFML